MQLVSPRSLFCFWFPSIHGSLNRALFILGLGSLKNTGIDWQCQQIKPYKVLLFPVSLHSLKQQVNVFTIAHHSPSYPSAGGKWTNPNQLLSSVFTICSSLLTFYQISQYLVCSWKKHCLFFNNLSWNKPIVSWQSVMKQTYCKTSMSGRLKRSNHKGYCAGLFMKKSQL